MKIVEVKSRKAQRTSMGLPYPRCETGTLSGLISRAPSENISKDIQCHSPVKICMRTVKQLLSFSLFKIDLCMRRSTKFTKQ